MRDRGDNNTAQYRSVDQGTLRAMVNAVWEAAQTGRHRPKPEQLRYTDAVITNLTRGSGQRGVEGANAKASVMLAGAETGIGKTLAFGVPLLAVASMGYKVAIATSGHALQAQYLGTKKSPGDLALAANWLEATGHRKPVIARRVGAHGFISASAIESLLSGSGTATGEAREDLSVLLNFAYGSNAGENSGLLEDALSLVGGKPPAGIDTTQICLDLDSDEADRHAYEAHLVAAAGADCVLVTHHYLLQSAAYRHGELIPGQTMEAVVIDEADQLESASATLFRLTASLRRTQRAIEASKSPKAAPALQAVRELIEIAQAEHDGQSVRIISTLPAAIRVRIAGAAHRAHRAVDDLAKQLARTQRRPLAEESIHQFCYVLSRFAAASTGDDGAMDGAISYSPSARHPSLTCVPRFPGALIAAAWNTRPTTGRPTPAASVLLTSATLGQIGHFERPADRFDKFARHVGLCSRSSNFQPRAQAETDLWLHLEPTRFGAMRIVLSDPAVPVPFSSASAEMDDHGEAVQYDEKWLDYAAAMIVRASETGGRTLVLVGSYRDGQALGERVQARGKACVIQQRGQSSEDCRAKFEAEPHAIWLSPTSWEGLNLPGLIDNLVIPRIPFLPPDPISIALVASNGSVSENSARAIIAGRNIDATKRLLRQGIGRAIRRATDKATIWIADPRFPLHHLSQLPMQHLGKVVAKPTTKQFPAFHAAIPARFRRALANASVYTASGELLVCR